MVEMKSRDEVRSLLLVERGVGWGWQPGGDGSKGEGGGGAEELDDWGLSEGLGEGC